MSTVVARRVFCSRVAILLDVNFNCTDPPVSYILLIPLNLFGLAWPVTTLLTLLPPTYLAAQILDSPESHASDESTKSLLSYFVVLGFIQFLESLAAGVLAKRIRELCSPQCPSGDVLYHLLTLWL